MLILFMKPDGYATSLVKMAKKRNKVFSEVSLCTCCGFELFKINSRTKSDTMNQC